MKIVDVVNCKDAPSYFSALFELMESYDGKTTKPQVVDEETGEVLVWEYRECYSNDYALICLQETNALTPKSAKLKETFLQRALLDYSALISYNNQNFSVCAYSGELRHCVVTMGLMVKRLKKKVNL